MSQHASTQSGPSPLESVYPAVRGGLESNHLYARYLLRYLVAGTGC